MFSSTRISGSLNKIIAFWRRNTILQKIINHRQEEQEVAKETNTTLNLTKLEDFTRRLAAIVPADQRTKILELMIEKNVRYTNSTAAGRILCLCEVILAIPDLHMMDGYKELQKEWQSYTSKLEYPEAIKTINLLTEYFDH